MAERRPLARSHSKTCCARHKTQDDRHGDDIDDNNDS